MKINIDLKALKKMKSYLCSSQIASMMDAIIDYTENGTEYEFPNKTMEMIWEDVKPDLDRSLNSYKKWLSEKMAEEAERIRINREGKGANRYMARVDDLNKDEPAPF